MSKDFTRLSAFQRFLGIFILIPSGWCLISGLYSGESVTFVTMFRGIWEFHRDINPVGFWFNSLFNLGGVALGFWVGVVGRRSDPLHDVPKPPGRNAPQSDKASVEVLIENGRTREASEQLEALLAKHPQDDELQEFRHRLGKS